MSRISSCFKNLREQGRTALVPFITAGDPDPSVTLPMMHTLVENGADIIELGVPFSDPMADGPVIQKASERALLHHIALHDVLDMVAQFRSTNTHTPVVLMGYLNPIEVMGYESFVDKAAQAGVDGVLTVDLPPEEGADVLPLMKSRGLDPIYLLAPTSHKARIEKVTAAASGFVYYVALKGVTGAGHLSLESAREKVAEIRSCTEMPVGVGFGIKDAETARIMADFADAVVIGSAIVSRMEQHAADPAAMQKEVGGFVSGVRAAIDAK